MDLSEAAAYLGKTYFHREVPEDGDYRGALETAFLCTISGSLGAAPDEYQFLEFHDIETFNEEGCVYRDLLKNYGVETVLRESRYPNAAYSANVYFGYIGDLYLSRMASEVRKSKEPETFAFAYECGYNPIVPFPSDQHFEISNAIPCNEGLVLGVGQRGMVAAARRLALIVEMAIVEISDDVQHLMGALQPLPDGRATVRLAHIENTEILEPCYEGKQAMNFTITADETILMPNEIPNAESKLAGQYDVETTSVDAIRAGADGLACLTRRAD